MKKIFILILVIFAINLTTAQQSQTQGQDTNIFTNPNSSVLSSFNSNLEGVVGKPYIVDFTLAKVPGYKENYLIRYDANKDQMQLKNFENQIIIIDKKTISEVKFGNGSLYKVYDYTFDKKDVTGYLKVINEGKDITLLKREFVKFYPARAAESSYAQDKKATYKKADDVYLLLNNQSNKIDAFSKKKDLIKLYPNKKVEITSFLKSNKIRLNRENDLIKLSNHLNSIL